MENSKNYKTNIKEIVYSDEEEKSFCDIFVYEPENIEEKTLGNLYIVGEVVNLPENSSYIVNLLASIIKKEFYSNKKRSTVESLEASLNKANTTLSEITEQGNVAWIGNLNMTCAAHRDKQLHLSQTGKIKTFLIRNGQIKDIGMNINSDDKPHPFRTFANIASGELEMNDLVLFATPGFFNTLSTEKIRQMSALKNFDEISNAIQNAVDRENKKIMLAALLVNIENKKEIARLPKMEIIKTDSHARAEKIDLGQIPADIKHISELNSDKEFAKNDFSESEKISLENVIKEIEENERKNYTLPQDTQEEIKNEKSRKQEISTSLSANEPKKSAPSIATEPLSDIKNVSRKSFTAITANAFKKTSLFVSNIGATLRELFSRLIFKKPNTDITGKLRFMRNSKIFLSIAAFLFIIILGNAVITNYNNQIEAEKDKYTNLLEKSKTKIDEADQVLIYGDSEKARQLLSEAKTFAMEARSGYKNLSPEANLVLLKIQAGIDKIDKVSRIDDPAIALDLSQNERISDITTLIRLKGGYYTLSRDNYIFDLNFDTGSASEIALSIRETENAGKAKHATLLSKTGEIIFLSEDNKILSFDSEKKELRLKKIEINDDVSDIAAIASYNSFIYLLEPGTNQIFKHRESSDGFGKGAKWLNEKAGVDIRNATYMTIDSTIYILRSNGQVEEYLTGNKLKFSAEELKDPMQNPTIIHTNSELKNLYVADPSKNRIAVFDKNKGALVKQFVVEKFNNNIRDIAVSEKEEYLYVVSGKSIFRLEIKNEIK